MKIKLSKLLRKNKALSGILRCLSETTTVPINIYDVNEISLIGTSSDDLTHRYPLLIDGKILGWVSGNEKTKGVMPILEYLIATEAGKKLMADEVLNAYREITLLYNISEKLTASLNVQNIIRVALSEASRLISGQDGVVLLTSQEPDREVSCHFGPNEQQTKRLGSIILDVTNPESKAEIVNDIRRDPRFSDLATNLRSLVWAPLKVKTNVLGIIMIGDARTDNDYSARDLGLLNTIASQTAPAVEKAADYENLGRLVEERTRELSEAKDAAETASQAKSQFLANMSHELRTPLNALLGYAQILRQEKQISETQRDGLDIIHRSGEHLLTLINDILDLSKIEAGKMELEIGDFDLQEMLRNLSQMFQLRARDKDISFEYHIVSELPKYVSGDEIKLRQVLINLLSNAIKFTDSGGVAFKVGRSGTKIRIEVEDTGIGIDSGHLQEIFQSFRQITTKDRMMEGTGLGLAISSKLADIMGGKLHVNSEPGNGSTFWLELDLPEAESATISPVHQQPEIIGYEGRRLKILAVEDREENRSVLLNILKPLGFEVIEAKNGREGIQKAAALNPDLILMDLVMPVMDGFEATRQIRALPGGDKVKIVALSASVFESDRQTTIAAGGNDFLPKPIRVDRLLDTLAKHLDIQWTYKKNEHPGAKVPTESLRIEPPPSNELETLFDFARQGNVRGIRSEIERIKQMDERFGPFAEKLHKLAKHFNMKQICYFLEPYIGRSNE